MGKFGPVISEMQGLKCSGQELTYAVSSGYMYLPKLLC